MRNIEQYKQLHNQEKDYGNSKDFLEELCLIIDFLKPKTILDYGCGKGARIEELKKIYPGIYIYGYDSAIEGKNFLPIYKADLVINFDVLEHIPEDEIEDVVKNISSISENVYFNLHHALASFHLPNGENAHCTIKPIFWYYELFNKYFKTQTILRGRYEWLSVILTFPIHGGIMENYYKITEADRHKQINTINAHLARLEAKKIFLQNIFSVKNEYREDKKYKVINIFGIKFKFNKFVKI